MHTLKQLRSGELHGCQRIQLAEQLTEFPLELFDLADTLEVLDLSNNQLTALPDDLPRLYKLKILFASNNPFTHLPAILGQCANLEMIGFKSNQIQEVSAQALPPKLRWLILTDNSIQQLPESIGQLRQLQKLMLAGNQLTELPANIAECKNLQLLRVSANRLASFPDIVLELPQLAWFAYAGNPFAHWPSADAAMARIDVADLSVGKTLGQGASGVISLAKTKVESEVLPNAVALKMFKGAVTSDGYPEDELQASLLAGHHHNIVEPLAQVDGAGVSGLVMRLIPDGYRNLGQPPSLESCTRDIFAADVSINQATADHYVAQLSSAVTHLHKQGINHGDVYAHNVLVNAEGDLLFGDFGAASPLISLTKTQHEGVNLIEQRAVSFFEQDMQGLVNTE